ncbi:helix-turn-helix protein [Devosia equisanguinis]|uniref:Helix-turn-helix protein n=1 Tax=Devosia equisanguinis TaxID=2490941 RepID=A0A447IAH2_9HYPH|nr:helix-turn-helix transcriptional regulator [Devosia equisanguinis]VDS04424.1 helix-turn-helix protein [Devosia equisanguinis]
MPKSLYTERHKAIAAMIAKTRRDNGFTQVHVAESMGGGWSQPIIASIERGGRRLDLVELIKLADIIQLDLHELIDHLRTIPDE